MSTVQLAETGIALVNVEGHPIVVWDLTEPTPSQLREWAKSFRQNYCVDDELDDLMEGTGLSRADYLNSLVFPDAALKPGPSIRAGDFAELLISDHVETLGYWVPRGKYAEKASRNESVKGVDVLGFKMEGGEPAPGDILLAFEIKAELTGKKYKNKLQVAINDSSKDCLRRGTSLNALKRRLIDKKRMDEAKRVSRFQNPKDNPYEYLSGAALVASSHLYDEVAIAASTVKDHKNKGRLSLMVVRGKDLMDLVHRLYEVAANEA